MRTGFPCNESRFFPVGIDLQGNPVSYTGFGFAVWFLLVQHHEIADPIVHCKANDLS